MKRENKTKPIKKATEADSIYTNEKTAKWIIDYFNPNGTILDASAGANAFFDNYKNKVKYRCEIADGSDFLEWTKSVDWIITNPPYSIYDQFLKKAFDVAENVVFLVPISKAFKSDNTQKMILEYGGLKEILYMGSGRKHKFPFGFPIGCLHYQKGFVGDCKITYRMDGW